jgi:hypothetical protein
MIHSLFLEEKKRKICKMMRGGGSGCRGKAAVKGEMKFVL